MKYLNETYLNQVFIFLSNAIFIVEKKSIFNHVFFYSIFNLSYFYIH